MNEDTREERKLRDIEERLNELEEKQLPTYGRKPKQNYSAATMPEKDRCGTPPYALEPLLPYIDKDCHIWECAAGNGLLVNALLNYGFKHWQIIDSDITEGDDFFTYDPKEIHNWRWDVIITNPPFSLKYQWIKRCYELGKPWALLMPSDTLFAASANKLFQQHGIEIIIMNPRVDFRMPNKGWSGNGAQMSTSWFTWGLNIGQMITFADISAAKKAFRETLSLL